MLGNVFILGDSYSTFDGYIPKGYAPYYDTEGPWYLKVNPEMALNENDVCDVTHTWWYHLTKENGKLIRNCSWSGTTICNTGYDGVDNSKVSFIARLDRLIEEGYFITNKIDTFFLFGGTNDSWSNAPLGDDIYSKWTKEDLYCVRPAFSYLIDRLIHVIPDSKIYCIINSGLKEEITEFYKSVCSKNNVAVIELHDIEKVCDHPTVNGMEDIRKQVLDFVSTRNRN